MRRYTDKDYKDLGRKHDLEWLGPMPDSLLDKTKWRCQRNGHVFEMRGANVHMGRSCPHCSHRWRRRGVDYDTMAKQHGLEWIGDYVPQSTRAKTRWRGPDGTIYEMPYRNLAARVTPYVARKTGIERAEPQMAFG